MPHSVRANKKKFGSNGAHSATMMSSLRRQINGEAHTCMYTVRLFVCLCAYVHVPSYRLFVPSFVLCAHPSLRCHSPRPSASPIPCLPCGPHASVSAADDDLLAKTETMAKTNAVENEKAVKTEAEEAAAATKGAALRYGPSELRGNKGVFVPCRARFFSVVSYPF